MSEDQKKINGLVKGKPPVPPGSIQIRRKKSKVTSLEFSEFLAKRGEELGLPKGGWRYVMEKWETPDGKIVKRHYWWHKKTNKAFYHLRSKDEEQKT